MSGIIDSPGMRPGVDYGKANSVEEFELWLSVRKPLLRSVAHWYGRLVMDGIGYGHELIDATVMVDNVAAVDLCLSMMVSLSFIRRVRFCPSDQQRFFGYGDYHFPKNVTPAKEGPFSWWSWTVGEKVWLTGGPVKCGQRQSVSSAK